MLKLLAKELKLTASILSYVFIVFALMAFLPGYPILVGTFLLLPRHFSNLSGGAGGKRYHLYGAFTGCKKRYC